MNTMTERLESSLEPLRDREWPYDQVEHERHNRGRMYQHCGRADAENSVGKREKAGRRVEVGVVVVVEGKVDGDANEWLASIKGSEPLRWWARPWSHPDHRLDRSPLHG